MNVFLKVCCSYLYAELNGEGVAAFLSGAVKCLAFFKFKRLQSTFGHLADSMPDILVL